MKKITLAISSALLATPFIAFAQVDVSFVTGFISGISTIVTAAVPVVVGLAVLLFLWGLARYMLNQDDAEARAGARSIMIWGIVIIFVMVSIWGLVALLQTFFGTTANQRISAPTVI